MIKAGRTTPGLLLLLVLPLCTVHAAKTDVVVLVNGDDVTGEVKSLEFGTLRYGTDSMGTVRIDWEDVVSVESDQALQVELTDGSRYFGGLVESGKEFRIRIDTASGEFTFPTSAVVRMTPIETAERFVQRLDGSFSLGFQTQKSSSVTTSSVNADVSHRSRRDLVGLRLNSSVTDQPSEPTVARQSLKLNYQRFRPNRWFTDWFTGWERNDELGINARLSLGAAIGRYLVQSNQNLFSLTIGAQAARSSFTGEDDTTTEAEGRIEARYLRRSLVPESSIQLTSIAYPLLEDLSQFRVESDLSFRRELIDDLFLELSIGHSYTSDPPTGAASSDHVVTTSLGYSF
jgi:hypothetical protein